MAFFGISTLGPCAEAVGISVMMVFCIGVAQLPIAIGLAMHVPAVRIDLYTPYMLTAMDPATNATAVVLPPAPEGAAIHASYMHAVNISGLFVLCASGFTFFVVLTMQFIERGLRGGQDDGASSLLAGSFEEEFVMHNVQLVGDPSFRLWNQSFVGATLLMHFVAAATLCSPSSTHMVVCVCLLFLASIGPLVHPMENFDSVDTNRIGLSSMVSQKVTILGFIYLAAAGIVLTSILVDAYSAKAQFFLLLCFMDAFMLFGHLWDRVPTLQVIVNCRLLYIIMLAAFNAAMLCLWKPYLDTPFLGTMAATTGAT